MAARPPCHPSETWAMQLACHGGASPARSRVRCPSNRPAAARLARAGRRRGRPLSAGRWKTWRASIASPPFHPPTHLTDRPARATGTRSVHGLRPTVWHAGRRRMRWSRTGPWLRGKAGGRRGWRKKKRGRAVSERRRRPRQFRPPCKGAKSALFEGARALGFPTRPGSGYGASPGGVGGGAQGGASPPGELRRGGPSTRAAARK